jgi:hypothetical protein
MAEAMVRDGPAFSAQTVHQGLGQHRHPVFAAFARPHKQLPAMLLAR